MNSRERRTRRPDLNINKEWKPPAHYQRITTIDAHTAGEPLRVITGGFPDLPGETMLAKRRYAKKHYDHLRKALMWEPRGHADMYGCIVTEPVTEDGTLGVIFMHNEGYSTMCGHGIIGLTTVLLETGALESTGSAKEIRMDTPAGRVTAYAVCVDREVKEVTFYNVPSFVYALDKKVEVPGLGCISVDIAFGGAFYAFVNAQEANVGLEPKDFRSLIETGVNIKLAVMDQVTINHPIEEDLSFLYGTIFVGPPHDPDHHSRNVCIFADGEVDRCPTGTGVSARAAIHYARGELDINQPFTVESILGTHFTGSISEKTRFGSYEAVIPSVRGTAHITGINEWLIDPKDPLSEGFLFR